MFLSNVRFNLAIRVKRRLNSTGVIDVLTNLFILHGVHAFYRPPALGNHRCDGAQADHALTFKSDHSTGADQDTKDV
jgi:hypothetical protein